MELVAVRAGWSCPFTHPIYKLKPEITGVWTGQWTQIEGAPSIPANVDGAAEIKGMLDCCNAEGACVDPFNWGMLNCSTQPMELPEPVGALLCGVLLLAALVRRKR